MFGNFSMEKIENYSVGSMQKSRSKVGDHFGSHKLNNEPRSESQLAAGECR